MNGAALLEVAELLVGHDDVARPRPSCLRRAVSSAYYALFHELICEAVHRAVGTDAATQAQRDTVSRWYSHAAVLAVSQWVVRRSAGRRLPDLVTPLLATCPPDLVAVAEATIVLQNERNEADYNPAATVTRRTVKDHITMARRAVGLLPGLQGEPGYHGYLLLLLGGPRLAIR